MIDATKRCATCTHFDKKARPNNPRYGRCTVPLPKMPAWMVTPDLYPRNLDGPNYVTTGGGTTCALWASDRALYGMAPTPSSPTTPIVEPSAADSEPVPVRPRRRAASQTDN